MIDVDLSPYNLTEEEAARFRRLDAGWPTARIVRYYDRDGRLIPGSLWGVLLEKMEYRRIELDQVSDGIEVSTVWLGLDHTFLGLGAPLIYETMVFVQLDEPRSLELFDRVIDREGTEMWRWSTEVEARAGHAAIVADLRAQIPGGMNG